MSGTEGQEPAGTDPTDLQLPRGAAGIGRVPTTEQPAPQASATPVTRLIDTKSLLQDSISWRQGKFSRLEMVLLDCSACKSANQFMKDSRKLRTT